MITYATFVKDIIDLKGEKWIKETFDSIKNQSDDIIVCDYASKDGARLKEMCDEYGFRFFSVERVEGYWFHMSKQINKTIIEAKNPFYVRFGVDMNYPPNLTEFILDFYENHDAEKECLLLEVNKEGSHIPSADPVYNRDLLIKARGLDERTTYCYGEHFYLRSIMLDVFKLKPFYSSKMGVIMKHKAHYRGPIRHQIRDKFRKQFSWEDRIKKLKDNFDEEVKNVVNSYW